MIEMWKRRKDKKEEVVDSLFLRMRKKDFKHLIYLPSRLMTMYDNFFSLKPA
jgi:hypothetical protein